MFVDGHQVAEMSHDPEFETIINEMIRTHDIRSIVETGLLHGLGSTMVFAKTGLPVHSIECNMGNIQIATRNLSAFNNVNIMYGLSVNYEKMKKFIEEDTFYRDAQNLNIAYETDGNGPSSFYLAEINYPNLKQDLLPKACDIEDRQIVLLDSAGGTGLVELEEFLKIKNLNKKILILDDVKHVKHYRSIGKLQSMGITVNISKSGRWAWVDFTKGK